MCFSFFLSFFLLLFFFLESRWVLEIKGEKAGSQGYQREEIWSHNSSRGDQLRQCRREEAGSQGYQREGSHNSSRGDQLRQCRGEEAGSQGYQQEEIWSHHSKAPRETNSGSAGGRRQGLRRTSQG